MRGLPMGRSKKSGVKKGSSKSAGDLYRQIVTAVNAYNAMCEIDASKLVLTTVAMQAQADEDIRHHTRVWMMDMASIALGRMGFREAKFKALDKALLEVVTEYDKEFADDYKDDKEMWYSREQLERELKEYTGAVYKPEDVRY